MSEPVEDHGGEPWWVVIFEMVPDEFASTAVEAPDKETATAHAQRVVVGQEGRKPKRHVRTRGPFPGHVPTEAREVRPKRCHGCGLKRFCGNHAPTPHQTWWELDEEQSTEDRQAWECIQCQTLTVLPVEGQNA